MYYTHNHNQIIKEECFMKPLHAYPHPERPQNPSPLEMAIYNYELKAKEFHNKRIAQKGQASEDLKNKMARDFNHLQKEKERITAHARLQTDLKEYRELSASSTVTQLKQEKHHPTQKLARHLAAIGELNQLSCTRLTILFVAQGNTSQRICYKQGLIFICMELVLTIQSTVYG